MAENRVEFVLEVLKRNRLSPDGGIGRPLHPVVDTAKWLTKLGFPPCGGKWINTLLGHFPT